MHLVDLLSHRARPFAGLFLGLTRRCPLHCAHCSTNSTLTSEQSPAEWYERFLATTDAADHPEVVLLSGGEPLLRPELVVRLTELAHAAGSRVALLTGAYWGERPVPPAVARAIDVVDLLSVSMDVFHEQEVPRAAVLDLLERRLATGRDASVQTIGADDDDPWVAALVHELEARFAGRLPVLVGQLGPSGREGTGTEPASTPVPLPTRARAPEPVVLDVAPAPEPCSFASWPVAGFDGTITACCQQSVVDAAPGHLRLGHLTDSTWSEVRRRGLDRPLLQAIRVYGPQHLAARAGLPVSSYCDSCRSLDGPPAVVALAEQLTSSPGFAFTAGFVTDALGALPLRGVPARYVELVGRGWAGPVDGPLAPTAAEAVAVAITGSTGPTAGATAGASAGAAPAGTAGW